MNYICMYTIMCNYIPVIRLNYANFHPCGYICLYIMGSTLSMIWYLVKALLSCAIQNRPHRCCLDHPASISPECSHGHHGSAVDPAIISSLDLDVARHVVVNPLYAHLSGAVGIRGNFVHCQSSRRPGHQGSEMTLYQSI